MLLVRRTDTTEICPTCRDTGTSSESDELCERVIEALRELRGERQGAAFNELLGAFANCGERGWDGEEAEPVSASTYVAARTFLRSLPASFPAPEVSPESDGSITFDWFPREAELLSVSVTEDGRVVWAGIYDGGQVRGIEVFHDRIPSPVLDLLRQLY